MTQYDYAKCDECGIELHASDMTRIGKLLICRRCIPAFTASIHSQRPVQVTKLPMFCRVVFTVDALFAAFRGIVAIMGIVALIEVLGKGQPQRLTVIQGVMEVATGLAIMIFGFLGNHMMLRRSYYGFYLGWGNIMACMAASAVGLLGIMTMSHTIRDQGVPVAAVFLVGLIIVGLRLVLNVIYGIALMQFRSWFDEQHDG